MIKKVRQSHSRFVRVITSLPVVLTSSCVLVGLSLGPVVYADQYSQQIQALQNQNNAAQSTLSTLQSQAQNYQAAISQLQARVAGLQNSIAANQQRQVQLQTDMQQEQAAVVKEKQLLGSDIKAMYVAGQMTTIEELATSKNISAYIDAQTYRNAVQSNIQQTLNQIASQEQQIKTQQAQVSQILKVLQIQQAQVAAAQSQQTQLLAYNQSQQAAFNQQIQANQSQIATLVAEQIAANKKLVSSGTVNYSGSCGGSYPATATGPYGPWGCNYPHSSDFQPGCAYMDSWGMCNRECVSYTAWMVYKNDGIDVTGFGNANQWPANAQAAGIPTGSTPQVGSVAIYMGGSSDPYGHAMWVVGVNGSMITVDQYNLYYDGNFYQTTIPAAGLTYIYFGK